MKPLEELVRPEILELKPLEDVRRNFGNLADMACLDLNETPFNKPYNRYGDPSQAELRKALSRVKGVGPESILPGTGTAEMVDLCYRCFARPGVDNVVAIDPTREVYARYAAVNGVEYRRVPLDGDFQVRSESLLGASDANTKIIWICSPNDPTGNDIDRMEIVRTVEGFDGIVVVDEAYSDFSRSMPLRLSVGMFPNLVVLNSMSFAWASASARMAMAFATRRVVGVLESVRYPHNVSRLVQDYVMGLFRDAYAATKWARALVEERDRMVESFRLLPFCLGVYPTDANFFLAKVRNPREIHGRLLDRGILVRDCSGMGPCDGCLRISVGGRGENTRLLSALRSM